MSDATSTGSPPAADQAPKTKIFISYSRKDTAFADQLEEAMKARGFEVFIDRHEISALEEWWKRIETLITQADTIVFVLSPDSVGSKFALKEIDFAASLNKRFAPVVYRRVDNEAVPEALAKLNYIFFDDGAKFEASADTLARALRIDIVWIRLHTEFGDSARQWSAANRPNGLLLRPPLLEEAERWIAARPEGAPALTEETRTFIRQSREAATQRRNILAASLGIGLIVALGLAGYAVYQRNQVQRELDRANEALAESIDNDLGIEIDKPLTARQRNALWKLADADEAVKRDFVWVVAGSANEMVRASDGLPKLLRAIGPLSPDELGRLLRAAIDGLPTSTDPKSLKALAEALQALAPRLTEMQASKALDPVLRQIDQTTDPDALGALAQALKALPAKLTDAQTSQALDPVLRQIGLTTDPQALLALAEALQALPAKLTNEQASRALDPVLGQIGQTTDPDALQLVAPALQALAAKMTDAVASHALDPVIKQFGQTTNPFALQALAKALQALAPKLTDAQASQALDPVLKQIGQMTNPLEVPVHVQTLQALGAKMTDAQASQALDHVLKQIGQTTDPTLDPVLKQIGQRTGAFAISPLAQALQALAPKLAKTQAGQALSVAASSFAWAASDDKATEWARALAALSSRLSDRDATKELVAAIAYPVAAGPATEVLLDAIRARNPDAPRKEAGTETGLKWLASRYPEVLRAPACPPPQPSSMSLLKCPVSEASN